MLEKLIRGYVAQGIVILIILFLVLVSSCHSSKAFTKKDVKRAQKLIGLDLSSDDVDVMYGYLNRNLLGYDSMRQFNLGMDVFPALLFDPLPLGYDLPEESKSCDWSEDVSLKFDGNPETVAFASISELAFLIKRGDLKSIDLTRMYLDRLKRYDPILKCVINLTEELALEQARKADEEIERGIYRGPLHGIPYGIKDLISVKGYPTTWGARPYQNQMIDQTATIVKRLSEKGAVLVAKLTSGALARGDVWFGGQTKNPWDTLQGASGSSAGPGSAISAGLVAFSIGTETLGSITSPSTRNGVTGLRPTYGRVSRSGIMSLSWSMDKVGPICRSAADCALVFSAIQGPDIKDPTTYDIPFCFNDEIDIKKLRIGYLKNLIEKDTSITGRNNRQVVKFFGNAGFQLVEDSLPSGFPFSSFDIILRSESGAFFDELVLGKGVDTMVEQGEKSRANSLRQSRFIPAVEYIQANRYRRLLIEAMHQLMKKYDVLITPTFGRHQLLITNLTGHPVVTIPNGFDIKNRPTSISFLGNLFKEEIILALANYYQKNTSYDDTYPPMFTTDENER